MAYSKHLISSVMKVRQRKCKETYISMSFMNTDAACFNKILIDVTCEYVRSTIRQCCGGCMVDGQLDSVS